MHVYASKECGIRIIPLLSVWSLKLFLALLPILGRGSLLSLLSLLLLDNTSITFIIFIPFFLNPYNLLNFIEFYSICQR